MRNKGQRQRVPLFKTRVLMPDKGKKKWVPSNATVNTSLAIVALGIGYWQFLVNQKVNSRTEFNRHLWELRVENYRQTLEVAGVLASAYTDDSTFKKSLIAFERIYWGNLNLFSDPPVDTALVYFRRALHDYDFARGNTDALKNLETRAYELAGKCNQSLQRIWQANENNENKEP